MSDNIGATGGEGDFIPASVAQEARDFIPAARAASACTTLTTESVDGPLNPAVAADHTGWLQKAGHFQKDFKRRFFILRGTKLAYYEDRAAASAPRRTEPTSDPLTCPCPLLVARTRHGRPIRSSCHHRPQIAARARAR